jgi:hypothetical protein
MLNKIPQVSKNNSVKDVEHPTTDSSSIIQDPKVQIIEWLKIKMKVRGNDTKCFTLTSLNYRNNIKIFMEYPYLSFY